MAALSCAVTAQTSIEAAPLPAPFSVGKPGTALNMGTVHARKGSPPETPVAQGGEHSLPPWHAACFMPCRISFVTGLRRAS